MDHFFKNEVIEKVTVTKRRTRSRITGLLETTTSSENTSINRDIDVNGQLLDETEFTERSTKRSKFFWSNSHMCQLREIPRSEFEDDVLEPSSRVLEKEDPEIVNQEYFVDEDPDSQIWDEIGEIALEQVERAASKWGSSSLGKIVQIFSKADAALDYVHQKIMSRDSRVYPCYVILACELPPPLSGFEYAAMQRNEFLVRYRDMNAKDRVLYELIDPQAQCHLYFDLEFSPSLNEEKDGNAMVETLLMITSSLIGSEFPHVRDQSPSILETDSSREDKFSRHLLIRVNGLLFPNNQEMLTFVRKICQHIEVNKGKFPAYENLFVETKKGRQLFIDLTVYKKKQLMRMPFSTKQGLSSYLEPTGRFGTPKSTIEDLEQTRNMFITAYDMSETSEFSKGEETGLDEIVASDDVTQKTDCIHEVFSSYSAKSTPHKMPSSPFLALDAFILELASQHCLPGETCAIRNVTMYPRDHNLVYSIKGTRYCNNVQRHHAKNNVMYVVNCNARTCYAKCHDFSCNGYVSPKVNVPAGCFNILPGGVTPLVFVSKAAEAKKC